MAQPRPVDVHLPYPKTRLRILPKIKDDFGGVEGQADLAEKPFASRHTRCRDDRSLLPCTNVIDINTVVGKKPVFAGAVIDIGVIMI